MDFEPGGKQQSVVESLQRLLHRECPPEALRAAASGLCRARWAALAGAGLSGLLIAPERGGGGGDESVLAAVAEVCGRHALPEPVLDTVAVVAPLLDQLSGDGDSDSANLLSKVLTGEHCPLLIQPGFDIGIGADAIDSVIAHTGKGWWSVPAECAVLETLPSLDPLRIPRRLTGMTGARFLGASRCLSPRRLMWRGAIAVSGELLGLGERILEMAVEYAKTRRQFGQPIGSFQAVQHPLAEVWTELTFARPVLYRAAWTVACGDKAAALHVSHARLACRAAAVGAAKVALQVFGARGYTYESDLHFWLKRVWALQDNWGDRGYHERVLERWLKDQSRLGPGGTFPHRRPDIRDDEGFKDHDER